MFELGYLAMLVGAFAVVAACCGWVLYRLLRRPR
jgi:hypothetical protein